MHREEIPNCNGCGMTTATRYRATPDGWGAYGLEARANGRYASPVLDDGITYSFRLCEGCLFHLMERFKLPPTVTGYNLGTGAPMSDPRGEGDALAALGFGHALATQ